MDHPVKGMSLDRFGDIFSGYFLLKCVHSVGHMVKLGSPVVDHYRNAHNLYKDLWQELAGCAIIDDMLPLLEAPLSRAKDYSQASMELADRIVEWSSDQKGFLWDKPLKNYFKNIANNMRLWVETCRQLE